VSLQLEKFSCTFSHFNRLYQCDIQMGGQPDRFTKAYTVLAYSAAVA